MSPSDKQRQRLVDVTELVALELGGAPRSPDATCEIADLRPRVDEDVIAEIERATVERCHLGATCEGPARSSMLIPTAPPVDVWTMTSVFWRTASIASRERSARLARRAIGVADVKVDHRGAGFATTRSFVGNLSCRNGNVRVLLARHLGADDRCGEDHVARRRHRDARRAGVASLKVLGYDAGAAGATDHDRRIDHGGGGCRDPGLAEIANDFLRFELDAARRVADRGENPASLDVVPRIDRGQKLDRLVGPKETLVAIEANEKLGGHIAEQRKDPRPVHQLAGVVGIVGAHSSSQHHREAYRGGSHLLRLLCQIKDGVATYPDDVLPERGGPAIFRFSRPPDRPP